MKKLLAWIVVLGMIVSLSFAFASTPREVVVRNSTELFRALKSNTVIRLEKGEYNTADISKTNNAFYNSMCTGEYSVQGTTIKNLKNVKIYSMEGALIYTDKEIDGVSDDCVLILSNCNNIEFQNISFGHKKKDSNTVMSCIAGVLAINSCRSINIINCDIFGCGFVGICGERSSGITVKDSKIHDCEASAFWLTKCKKVRFYSTELYNNGIGEDYYGLCSLEESDVVLSMCNVHDNGALKTTSDKISYMADGDRSELVAYDCTFANNHY